MKKVYLTQKGYQDLTKELEHLKKTKRRDVSKAIGKARELGDLSENAEYHAAKEEQGHIEKRIAELETTLANATIIENTEMSVDEANIGATLTLKDMDSGEEMSYYLVSEEEADIAENKISITSPVGAALMGHKVKEIVEIKVPAGILKYKILKITR
ncbi:MAG: transcription elongation factor GreA [Candidatus Omnitrophota bacterium]